jgi:hypothetical protein
MADEPDTPLDRVQLLHELSDAARAITRAKRALGVDHSDLADVDDLRWLVGKLAMHTPGDTLIPPRLTTLVHSCVTDYLGGGVSRFTVATPLADATKHARGVAAENIRRGQEDSGYAG